MPQSFRLKIGLLSMCLSGLLLLGFGLFSISALDQVGCERIDRELRVLADAQVRKVHPPGHWRRFEESLWSIYGDDAARQFAFKVTLPNGELLYASGGELRSTPLKALPLSLASAPENVLEAAPAENGDSAAAAKAVPLSNDTAALPAPRPEGQAVHPTPPRRMQVRGPVFKTLKGPGDDWRAMTLANPEVTLSLAMNLSGVHDETLQFRAALLVAVPLGLLLIVAGGWLIGHLALRPIKRIARTAESLTASRLHERIPAGNADTEFKSLIVLINGMLERLERSFQQATRFSADAAHELKTPLAILQAQVERSLQRAADGSVEQREYAGQLDEVQRLKSILAKLLLLAQADAGQLPLAPGRVDLAERVRAAAEDVRMFAADRTITVKAPPELAVKGDADLVNQLIANLVSNAAKFGAPDGAIGLELVRREGAAVLTVSNAGFPIPDEDRGRIFERFFRGDRSRSRKIGGAGLGLSLAREIARAHGGDLVLERSDAALTVFKLTLPTAG